MASAGTVSVDFAAETAKFTAELKKVQGSLKRLESDFKSIEKVAGVALRVFSGAALVGFARQAFEAADATATAAERAGIAVETFSRLQFAAGQTDVEMAALTTGIQRFQISLSKADDESKQAIATLSRFGLQAEQLKKLSIEDQLAAVADAFTQISNPADRTRLAVELFGKSAGPQLVPLLAQGKAGIQQLTAEADRLGITLTSSTAAGIDQADRAIKQLTSTLSSYTSKFLAGLSVAILGPPDEILKIDNEIEKLQQRAQQIRLGVGGQDPAKVLGEANPLVAEYRAANAEIDKLLNKQRELLGLNSPASAAKQTSNPLITPIQEIDIAAIQAMKIEVNDLAIAYANLDKTVRSIQDARVTETLEQSTVLVVEAQKEVEAEITRDLEFQLQARSAMQSQYREQQYQQEISWALARERLETATLANIMGALQSFAGQSERVAITLVAIQKAQALAQAIQLGFVAIAQAAASAPPPANAPAIFWAKALMAANVAGILASGYGQVRQIRSNGGAPIGSPTNPANVTSSSDSEAAGASSQRALQVVFAGPIFNTDQTKRFIVDAIREAVDDTDAIIISTESRQAQELIGG